MANFVYIPTGLEPFKLSGGSGLTFEKQVAYAGKFWHPVERAWFAITSKELADFEAETNRSIENGNRVTLPKQHTFDPEENRGLVTKIIRKPDSQGRDSVYAVCEFVDAEAAKLAALADVSIYAPAVWEDGKGNVYKNPIRHVALTNDPVLTGMEPFQVIAASMVPPKEKDMDMQELLAKLGIQAEPGKEADAIVEAFSQMAAKVKAMEEKQLADPPAEPNPDDEKDKNPPQPTPPASMLSLLRENREMKLNSLVEKGAITRAVADDLKKSYVNDMALKLSCTQDVDPMGFDALLSALAKNDPVALGETTGAQTLRLSRQQGSAGGESPVVAAARARSGK